MRRHENFYYRPRSSSLLWSKGPDSRHRFHKFKFDGDTFQRNCWIHGKIMQGWWSSYISLQNLLHLTCRQIQRMAMQRKKCRIHLIWWVRFCYFFFICWSLNLEQPWFQSATFFSKTESRSPTSKKKVIAKLVKLLHLSYISPFSTWFPMGGHVLQYKRYPPP